MQSLEAEKETEQVRFYFPQQRIENIYRIVRKIQLWPPFGNEWLQQAQDFEKLVQYSNQEYQLEFELQKEIKQKGMAKKTTLWETNNVEKSMRIITEEAKVNLMFRILKEYYQLQKNQEEYKTQITLGAERLSISQEVITSKMVTIFTQENYIENLGTLFQRLFEHEEALQLSGNQLLIEHIADALKNAFKQEFVLSIERKQEFLVIHNIQVVKYLQLIIQKIYSLDEVNIFHWIQEYKIFKLLVDFITRYHYLYSKQVTVQFLETLSLMAETELFKTRKQEFVSLLDDAQTQFAFIKNTIFPEISNLFPEKKAVLRPFREFIEKQERDMKFKQQGEVGSKTLDILNSL